MSDAYEHLRQRAEDARLVLEDADATFEELDLAVCLLGGLSLQMADMAWPDERYVTLYEEVGDWRVAVLRRMADVMR